MHVAAASTDEAPAAVSRIKPVVYGRTRFLLRAITLQVNQAWSYRDHRASQIRKRKSPNSNGGCCGGWPGCILSSTLLWPGQ